MNRKSQLFSVDLNVSLFIFISFTLLAIFLYNYTATQIDDYISIREMEDMAMLSTDVLVTTPGFPPYWNSAAFVSIGLADEENILNYTKIEELNNTNYLDVKPLITQGIYDFYINITYLDGSIVMTYGQTDTSSAGVILPFRRFCLLDNGTRRPIFLDMVMWR